MATMERSPRDQLGAAIQCLIEACKRGSIRMTVPVNEGHDDDRVIANALAAGHAALDALETAHPIVCSMKCPSMWKTDEGQPGPSPECAAVSKALYGTERHA